MGESVTATHWRSFGWRLGELHLQCQNGLPAFGGGKAQQKLHALLSFVTAEDPSRLSREC